MPLAPLHSISALGEDGWVLIPGLLSAESVPAVAAQADAATESERMASGCERPNNTLVPLRWTDPILGQVLGDSGVTERIRTASGATELRWTSAYISLKKPRSGALWWHNDWWAWEHAVTRRRQAAQIAVLIYLDNTTPEEGALRVLPGTHMNSHALHAELPAAHADPAVPAQHAHPVMRDHPEQVTVPAAPGDAVVIDYRLLHGTHPHGGPRRRRCLILNFAPHWNHLPQRMQAHLARGLALPANVDERESANRTRLAPLLPPQSDPTQPDLPLSQFAPAAFANLR